MDFEVDKDGILYLDGKLYEDPIHGKVKADSLQVDIMNTKSFQRLFRIGQNGFSYVDFKGLKNNTRGGHSITSMVQAKKDLGALRRNGVETTKLLIPTTNLLHDEGHGAYSHSFERIVTNSHHEQITSDIILGNTDTNRVLAKHLTDDSDIEMIANSLAGNRHQEISSMLENPELRKLLSKHMTEADIKMMQDTLSEKQYLGIMNKLVSGLVDPDRKAYIRSDSHFAGLPQPFIPENLEKALMVAINDKGKAELCLDADAKMDIIAFFDIRKSLYENVYFSHGAMASDASLIPMLHQYVPWLLQNGHIDDNGLDEIFIKAITKRELSTEERLQTDDAWFERNLEVLSQKDDPLLKYLCADGGATALRDFIYRPDIKTQDAYGNLIESSFGENRKSYGLVSGTAKYSVTKPGAINIYHRKGGYFQDVHDIASLAANRGIVDLRVYQNKEILRLEHEAISTGSPYGEFLKSHPAEGAEIDKG